MSNVLFNILQFIIVIESYFENHNYIFEIILKIENQHIFSFF